MNVLMLPGASAFLSGFGPARRYPMYLESQGYPVDEVKFNRCRHKFHFGGDGESWSHWVVQLPMCLDGRLGSAQVFLLAGETPLLCGRPIIEALGLSMDFASRAIRFHDGAWQSATLGLHGEYLLPLWNPEQPILDFGSLDFDLRLAPDGEVDPQCITFRQFTTEEAAFSTMDFEETPLDFGEQVLRPHQLQTFEQCILEDHNNYHGYVTQELHSTPKPRLIWEVYTSHGRLSSVAAALGAQVEVFGYSTGWDFDDLERLEAECPDELFLSPSCGPWSTMHNLNARTEEQQHQLQELREWHHSRHLQFVKKAYLTQVRQGGHAHVEQPAHALSWRTSALVKLPGYQSLINAVLAAVVRMMRATGFWLRNPLHFRPPSSPSSRSFIKFGALAIINIALWKARPLDLAVEHDTLRAINLALLQCWPQLSWSMSLLPSVTSLALLEKIANMWVPTSS